MASLADGVKSRTGEIYFLIVSLCQDQRQLYNSPSGEASLSVFDSFRPVGQNGGRVTTVRLETTDNTVKHHGLTQESGQSQTDIREMHSASDIHPLHGDLPGHHHHLPHHPPGPPGLGGGGGLRPPLDG